MLAESSLLFNVCHRRPSVLGGRCRIVCLVLCVMGLCGTAQAQTAEPRLGIPAGTSTYAFVATESTASEVYSAEVYGIVGGFELIYDPDTHFAAILQVDIQASDDPNGTAPDLNTVFDFTALSGAAVNDTTINFAGTTSTGRNIDLELTFDGDAAYLSSDQRTSRTRSSRSVNDRYKLDALAWRQYGGEVTIPEGSSTYVLLPDLSTLTQDVGFCGVHRVDTLKGQCELTVDLLSGTGSLESFTASAVDAAALFCVADPNVVLAQVFDVRGCVGTVVNESTVYLHKDPGGDSRTDVVIVLTFDSDTLHLAGHAFPSGGCYDCLYHTIDIVAARKYGGGTGEPNNPYLIYTPEQLNALGAEPNDWARHFRLVADIDLATHAETGFNVIGPDVNTPFTGVFDGSDHVISNFCYVLTDTEEIGYWGPESENVGLFGVVDDPNATIRNLVLEAPEIRASQTMAVGALVGYLRHGELTGCCVRGGEIWALILGGCLVGRSNGTIAWCWADGGHVTGNSTLGGLVGSNSGTITACHASANVAGFVSLGGLAGANGGDITACCAAGGTVSGLYTVGGLVGHSDRAITDCYATDTVSGATIVGGLVGHSGGAIRRCYAAGAVSGRENVGGLLGRGFQGDGTGCFWDIETTGQSTSAAGLGRTTAQMQVASMFRMAGWDFAGETENGTDDIWWMPLGQDYPKLWWETFPVDVTE